jgi:hypothetical protein
MKRGWKVGDRCIVSYISAVGIMCTEKATIKAINPGGGLVVEKDRIKGETSVVHPRQLRRLVRKNRREGWICMDSNVNRGCNCVCWGPGCGSQNDNDPAPCIRFREVKSSE